MRARRWIGVGVLLLGLLTLVGCRPSGAPLLDMEQIGPLRRGPPGPPQVALRLGVANYSDSGLRIARVNGVDAAYAMAGESDKAGICCVTLPRQWTPDLRVQVAYQDNVMNKRDWSVLPVREIPVPAYPVMDEGILWLLYFPDQQLRVVVSKGLIGSPAFGFALAPPAQAQDPAQIARFLKDTAWMDPYR